MSSITRHSAHVLLPRDRSVIRKKLLDVESLPAWNPAFSHVGPANANGAHPVVVHNLLRGSLTCTQPTSDAVKFLITIPGLREESVFTLVPDSQGTKVTHTIKQSGLLTAIIGDREASLVPYKRLTRLAYILNTTHVPFTHE